MRARAALGAIVIGIAALAACGCSAALLTHLDAVALDGPPETSFPPGATRRDVEARLGGAAEVRELPDGSRLARYPYTLRRAEWASLNWQFALFSVMTAGFWEGGGVPLAAYEGWKQRRIAAFVYDASGMVSGHGAPPAYGGPDDALPRLSLDEIRVRCRTEHPDGSAAGYDRCVVTRVALWAIE